jgi:hypothetical protein
MTPSLPESTKALMKQVRDVVFDHQEVRDPRLEVGGRDVPAGETDPPSVVEDEPRERGHLADPGLP